MRYKMRWVLVSESLVMGGIVNKKNQINFPFRKFFSKSNMLYGFPSI